MGDAGAQRSSVPDFGVLVAGRYRVGRELGEGGMGVVLEATDEHSGQPVALKLLQVVVEDHIERFLREARLSSKIDSEHVVRVLDMGTLDGHPFIVMERLVGEDFGAKIRTKAMPPTEVVDCLLQTCEALAHAHAAGIIHRDIKASNLFEHEVSLPGGKSKKVVKVLDFGISKYIGAGGPNDQPERTLTRTRDGGFLGSPPYMSPEHVRDPRHVDGRADIWSLGVVAYRLVSREYPFDGESTGQILAAILEGKPPSLKSHGVKIGDALEKVILKCLERNRDDRYPDVGALAMALLPFASPAMRSYGARVRAILDQSPSQSQNQNQNQNKPITVNRKKKAFVPEPSTRTVPPPVDTIEPEAIFPGSGEDSTDKMVGAPIGTSKKTLDPATLIPDPAMTDTAPLIPPSQRPPPANLPKIQGDDGESVTRLLATKLMSKEPIADLLLPGSSAPSDDQMETVALPPLPATSSSTSTPVVSAIPAPRGGDLEGIRRTAPLPQGIVGAASPSSTVSIVPSPGGGVPRAILVAIGGFVAVGVVAAILIVTLVTTRRVEPEHDPTPASAPPPPPTLSVIDPPPSAAVAPDPPVENPVASAGAAPAAAAAAAPPTTTAPKKIRGAGPSHAAQPPTPPTATPPTKKPELQPNPYNP